MSDFDHDPPAREALERGRKLYEQHAWADAYRVLSAAERSGMWPGALNAAFARALLEQHGPAALKIWRARRGEENSCRRTR